MMFFLMLLAIFVPIVFSQDNSPVTNLKIQQRPKSGIVEITYDLIDPEHSKLYLSLEGSSNNGTFWSVEMKSLSGDTGLVRVGRGKKILWNADVDYPKQFTTAFRIKIKARNRMCPQRGDEGMVFIPAGVYRVGERENKITDYCIDKWEFPNVRGDYPDVYISYEEASDSCNKLGKRLCTELQWEYACAGKSASPFPYGWTYNKDRCNTEGDTTQIIGVNKYCASEFGVYDLSGNVYEWVADAYVPDNEVERMPPEHSQSLQKRAIRGGNYNLGESYSRCDTRQWEWPKNATRQLGFRCCYTFSSD